MTNYDFATLMGKIDKDIIEQADNAIIQKKKEYHFRSRKWLTIAAVLVLTFIFGIHFIDFGSDTNLKHEVPPATAPQAPFFDSQLSAMQGIYVEGKLYFPDIELSKEATKDNVGHAVGYISFDNKTISDICAFEYAPNDGKTDRIIICVNDAFYVYSFYS